MEYPRFVKINEKKYKINTSFRIAIECDKIARDETIGDYERALAIIYKLYGDEGLNNPRDYQKLLELGQKYLSCGKEVEQTKDEPDMDFEQDIDYIEASFMSDFSIDLETQDLHWWKFMNLLCGLSNSDVGNCCILNRIRNLRNYDTSKIKDLKTKNEIEEEQKRFAIKKDKRNIKKEFNDKQKENIDNFMNSLRKE